MTRLARPFNARLINGRLLPRAAGFDPGRLIIARRASAHNTHTNGDDVNPDSTQLARLRNKADFVVYLCTQVRGVMIAITNSVLRWRFNSEHSYRCEGRLMCLVQTDHILLTSPHVTVQDLTLRYRL